MRSSSIHVSVDPALFAAVPVFERTIAFAAMIGSPDDRALADVVNRLVAERAEDPTPIVEFESIIVWRKALKGVGIDPTKDRPAHEAIARRAAARKLGPLGLAAIDLGTAVMLEGMLPVGVHTLDEVEHELHLGPADGTETFVSFAGKVEQPDPGEIIWRSGSRVLTRKWVHRQGAFGSVTPTSREFAINFDRIADPDPGRTLSIAQRYMAAAGLQLTEVVVLNASHPAATIARPT